MPSKRELSETVETLSSNLENSHVEYNNLEERLAELELALEDVGYTRLSFEGAQEFSRDGLRRIANLSRLFYLKNPLIKRGVDVQSFYVFGQGMSINAESPEVDEVVQAFLVDSKNQAELTSHQARMGKECELQVESNIFFVFFTDAKGRVRIRTIPFDEVSEITANPEDRKDPWFYRRDFTQTSLNTDTGLIDAEVMTAYYPDWRYSARDKPATIGGIEVMWDTPVYFIKTGGLPSMSFGVPEVYAALDWARAYKEFLANWSTIVQAYARFAWNLNTKGGSASVAAAKTKLQSTMTTSSSGETNPPPVTGSTFITAGGADLQPIRTAGATTSAEDGRRLLLMVAASMGLPESFFGDVSVGTLATAKSLDRPTELKMVSRQTLWADIYRDILDYVVLQAVKAGTLKGNVMEEEDGTPVVVLDIDPETGEPASTHINISFPPILEHDVNVSVDAIVNAATLKGQMPAGTIPDMETLSRMLLTALGEENIDGMIDAMFPEEEPTPEAKLFVKAVEELREAVGRLANGAT